MNTQLNYFPVSSDKEGSCNTPQNIHSSFNQLNSLSISSLNQSMPGSPVYTVKIDWLTIVADLKSPGGLDELMRDVEDIFTDKFVVEAGAVRRGRLWTGGFAKSQYGIELTWDSLVDEQAPRLRLAIPGQACSRADVLDYAIFLNGLKEYDTIANVSCTRLDAAFDDYSRSLFSHDDLYAAWLSNAIVRLQNKSHHMNISGSSSDEFGLGWTHRWGRGRKTITFYNKAAESKGEIRSHRIEVRYLEKDADLAFQMLTGFPMDDFAVFCVSFLSGVVAGMVDFMRFDRSRSHGVRDGKRLGWWQRVLDVQEGLLRFSAIPPKPNLSRKTEWLKRQVVTSLAQVADVIGEREFEDWLDDKVARARARYKDNHRAFIQTSKLEMKRGLYADGSEPCSQS